MIVQEISLPARLVLRLFGTCMKRVIEDVHDICASSQRTVQDNETSLHTTMSVESRALSDRSQRNGQCEYMAPRFMVAREAMAGQTQRCTRWSVCGSRFLWSPALRRVSSSNRWATRWEIYLRPSKSSTPPSTPAMEVRVVPMHNLYVKSMVLAAVRTPFSQNPTGLVPQFNGTPVSVFGDRVYTG